MLTHREAKYVAARLNGVPRGKALGIAGFRRYAQLSPSLVETPEMLETVERLQKELIDTTLHEGLFDAKEAHEYLTEAVRADMRDIRNEDGSFKPQSEWPDIWGQMMEAGDIEVERQFDRSNDGKDAEKRGGWDESGTVTKVKLKFSSRVKMLELAMKHSAVNAMVQDRGPDVHVHLNAEVTAKLQGALARRERLVSPVQAVISK